MRGGYRGRVEEWIAETVGVVQLFISLLSGSVLDTYTIAFSCVGGVIVGVRSVMAFFRAGAVDWPMAGRIVVCSALAGGVVSFMFAVHDRVSESEEAVEAANAQRVETRSGEQLNILVFDATSPRTPMFRPAVGGLKSVLNDCSIDARVDWQQKYSTPRTIVYYQEERARLAAEEIADLLPGNQDTEPLPSTFFGIHRDRDIVMLLGQDAGFIARNIRTGIAASPAGAPCPGFP